MATGARLVRKAAKSRPAAEPMRMLGGSPMSVAVPPMLEARIWLMRYGTGDTPSLAATARVTGVISTTVVTLSRNAETTAVTTARMISSRSGWPCDARTDRIASHSKNPVCARIPASTIIPASRKMTLRSMASKACSWSRTPRTTIARPPSRAAMVRSTRSDAIRAYVTRKTAAATQVSTARA